MYLELRSQHKMYFRQMKNLNYFKPRAVLNTSKISLVLWYKSILESLTNKFVTISAFAISCAFNVVRLCTQCKAFKDDYRSNGTTVVIYYTWYLSHLLIISIFQRLKFISWMLCYMICLVWFLIMLRWPHNAEILVWHLFIISRAAVLYNLVTDYIHHGYVP